MNVIMLIGRLGADPERRETTGGQVVAKFSLATNAKGSVDWHRVAVWGAQAEACVKYLHKGSQVGVEGRMTYSSWDDKNNVRHTSSEVSAFRVEFLSDGQPAHDQPAVSRPERDQASARHNEDKGYSGDDNIPF